jgi:hypothetical protein
MRLRSPHFTLIPTSPTFARQLSIAGRRICSRNCPLLLLYSSWETTKNSLHVASPGNYYFSSRLKVLSCVHFFFFLFSFFLSYYECYKYVLGLSLSSLSFSLFCFVLFFSNNPMDMCWSSSFLFIIIQSIKHMFAIFVFYLSLCIIKLYEKKKKFLSLYMHIYHPTQTNSFFIILNIILLTSLCALCLYSST